MKSEEFYGFFPRANVKHFLEDSENNVLFDPKGKFNPDDILDDVSEPAFWQGIGPKYLGLSEEDLNLWRKDKLNFFRKYKSKHYFHEIKNDPDVAFSILTDKIWEPEEWGYNADTIIPNIVLKTPPKSLNFEKIKIYVNQDEFFVLEDKFPTFKNINEINWEDSKNEYTLFLKAMYVLSYLGGMSIQNLKSENNLARSFAHFFFYYHLKKFLNYRDFSNYNTEPLQKVPLFKSLYYWTQHHVYFHPHMKMGDSEFKKNKHDVIANVHKDGKWIKWQTREGKRDLTKDYLRLISNNGNGITKKGQLLLQESIQAYVYCVLGAQAKTRWKIIGDGANSYQTQNVFKTLVREVLTQNNTSSLIKNMRIAIEDTKVRLNFCISPGLELFPSDMLYIKDSPGYNNILLISSDLNNFGANNSVNNTLKRSITSGDEKTSPPEEKTSPPEEKPSPPEEKTTALETINKQNLPQPRNNTAILIEGSFIAAIARVLWLAIF